MTHRVMLKPSWPSSFHRTVTVDGVKSELFFQPGIPVELSDDQFAGIEHDIGKALLLCDPVEQVKPTDLEALQSDGTPAEQPKSRNRKRRFNE